MSLHVPFRFDYVGSFLRDEKLLKARLVQRFPDTIEEIEAHAFNYRHGL